MTDTEDEPNFVRHTKIWGRLRIQAPAIVDVLFGFPLFCRFLIDIQ